MKFVILDVDTGIDDALAIAYALHSPELKVLGITTGFGNVSAEEATRNTLQVLDLLDAEHIPVIPGAEEPLLADAVRHSAYDVHGKDGLGNTNLPAAKGIPLDRHASDFIISKIKEFPHQLTLITVGTQTNLAPAIRKAPEIVKLVEEVIIMGGAVTVPGNTTPYAEANFFADAKAADEVLHSGMPILLVGLDVTMKTLLKREDLATWRSMNSPLYTRLSDMSDFYMDFYERVNPGLGGCALHDPLAVGAAIDRSFVKSIPMELDVVTAGEALGQSIQHGGDNSFHNAVNVCIEVDASRFEKHFLDRIINGLLIDK